MTIGEFIFALMCAGVVAIFLWLGIAGFNDSSWIYTGHDCYFHTYNNNKIIGTDIHSHGFYCKVNK